MGAAFYPFNAEFRINFILKVYWLKSGASIEFDYVVISLFGFVCAYELDS